MRRTQHARMWSVRVEMASQRFMVLLLVNRQGGSKRAKRPGRRSNSWVIGQPLACLGRSHRALLLVENEKVFSNLNVIPILKQIGNHRFKSLSIDTGTIGAPLVA